MQGREIDGETQSVFGGLRTINAYNHRTLVPRQGRTWHRVGDRFLGRRKRIGDGVLHGCLFIIEDKHHGDGHLRLLCKRSGKRSQKPSCHASKRTTSDDDLLGVLADFQKRCRSGGFDGGEFDAVLVNRHALRGLGHPFAQPTGDIMTHLRPLLLIFWLGSHIP